MDKVYIETSIHYQLQLYHDKSLDNLIVSFINSVLIFFTSVILELIVKSSTQSITNLFDRKRKQFLFEVVTYWSNLSRWCLLLRKIIFLLIVRLNAQPQV